MSDDLSRPPGTLDSMDELLATAVAAPSALAVGAVVAERYAVERVLGSGGMGTVYLARDRTLDRDVALKVHRGSADPDRMRREAVAMAKLAHPNVVTVFEVGALDEHAFVAMEYVPGETLRAWARGRSWRAVLAALVAAGEGLVAVHAAGLVHRDVKPDNILVGTDGRVRIGDFGLARLPGATGRVDGKTTTQTATGAVLGTPAYMAPEQLRGERVDARSDQFAFCVAAWEVLCDVRPFAGDTVEDVAAAVARSELVTGERDVPARVRRVLARGLAEDPDARYPSMSALLRALRAAERRGRVIWTGVAASIVAAAAIAYAAWPARDPAAACGSAGDDIGRLFPADLIANATRALPNSDQLLHAANDLRTHYRALASNACRAHARGEWGKGLVDASRECLAYGAATGRELIVNASSGGGPPADMAQVALDLPALDSCGDPRLLAGWHHLADDPSTFDAIVSARARLDAALRLIDLGRLDAARKTRDSLANSPVARVPEVNDRLELLRALIELDEHAYGDAEQRMTNVYFASRSRDDGELALLAAYELITTATDLRHDPEATSRWIRDGIAEAERDAARLPDAAAAVYIAAANASVDAGDSKAALADADRADQLLAKQPRTTLAIALLGVRANALADLGKIEDALATSERQLAAIRSALGSTHPTVATALAKRAALLLDARRDEQAKEAAEEAMKLLGDSPAPSPTLAMVEENLGATLVQLEDPRAQQVLEHARRGWVAVYGEDHPDVALIDTNLSITYMDVHDYGHALAALKHALAVQEKMLGPEHAELAGTLFNIAVAQRESKLYADALASAQRSVAIYEKHLFGTPRQQGALALLAQIENLAGDPKAALATATRVIEMPSTADNTNAQAWARLEAVHALMALHGDVAHTRALLMKARELYASIPLAGRVKECDELLAKLR